MTGTNLKICKFITPIIDLFQSHIILLQTSCSNSCLNKDERWFKYHGEMLQQQLCDCYQCWPYELKYVKRDSELWPTSWKSNGHTTDQHFDTFWRNLWLNEIFWYSLSLMITSEDKETKGPIHNQVFLW